MRNSEYINIVLSICTIYTATIERPVLKYWEETLLEKIF